MKYSLSIINLFLAQHCWSVYALDQNIPVSVSDEHYQRRVEEVVSDLILGIPVSYGCEFINRWTSSRHPNQFPSSDHWSPPLIASHNRKYTMWSNKQVSSPGVEEVAETGSLNTLNNELTAAEPMVKDVGRGNLFFPSGDFESIPIQGQLEMDFGHRFISSITMIAPSPDWFSGLNTYSPVMNGRWLSSFTVDSYPWDAGSENGSGYNGSNSATNPKVNSFRFTVDTVPTDTNVFLNTAGDDVLPVAQWSCTLIPGDDCREDNKARFFRGPAKGNDETRDRRQTCRWLGEKQARIDRLCARTRTSGPQPKSNLPLAREVCRETCMTCPPPEPDDE